MCTAATYLTKDFYFGRTLDYDFAYPVEVTLAPRNFPLPFRHGGVVTTHYAILGMALVAQEYPLYFDAVNEKGLAMAGLNFVNNAVYREVEEGKENVAQFEFIPWVLSQCASVAEARALISRMNMTNTAFGPQFPPAKLHWILADRKEAITVESVEAGIRVYDNPQGVLTNDPAFDIQLFNLNHYLHLTPDIPQNLFSQKLSLRPYSRGMGALGLPGDISSQSRFVRAAFVKMNGVSGDSEMESVSQFFHILGTVDNSRGVCRLENGEYEITQYTSCCNADKGIYYYTTYENHQISAVDMHRCDLDSTALSRYPLVMEQQIHWQN